MKLGAEPSISPWLTNPNERLVTTSFRILWSSRFEPDTRFSFDTFYRYSVTFKARTCFMFFFLIEARPMMENDGRVDWDAPWNILRQKWVSSNCDRSLQVSCEYIQDRFITAHKYMSSGVLDSHVTYKRTFTLSWMRRAPVFTWFKNTLDYTSF